MHKTPMSGQQKLSRLEKRMKRAITGGTYLINNIIKFAGLNTP
jgi:hypothetical protein